MQQENVPATVALERMWIYARELSVTERETLSHSLLSGSTVTYLAHDSYGKVIGRTRIKPEQFPVITVTETTF